MSKLLLVSSSRVHGTGYLEHCRDAVIQHFAGVESILFVPYALADRDRYRDLVSDAFESMGLAIESIHDAEDPVQAIKQAKGIFVGGGNTFRLLKTLYGLRLIDPIRERVLNGLPYMGSSAGTNLTCPTIRTTNDMPIVEPPTFAALGLVPFQINPHFIDADPSSTHKGETREQRLAEYLEENNVPVVGIREGSWLLVEGQHCHLHGTTGMKLFRQGKPPEEFSASDVSFLMNESKPVEH